MSKNIIDIVGDSVADCVKAVVNITNSSEDKDTEGLNTYVSGMLGGTLLSFFSLPIGLPVLLLSTAGGVIDVLLTKDKDVEVETEVEKINVSEDEFVDDSKYDIFSRLGCKNAMKEYPRFLGMQDGGYIYTRPQGIKISDIKEYADDICLELNLEKLEVLLMNNNKNLFIREFEDKLGSFVPYENIKRNTEDELKCYIGRCLKKGEIGPLEINFTKDNHIMISSCTGMGKSSVIRVMLTDLMLNYTPDELKFYLVDMKRTELTLFDGYEHCVIDCITEHQKVVEVLNDLWDELSNRKAIVESVKLKDMYAYNKKYPNEKMPYIVLVIDEMLEVVNSGEKEDIKEAKRLLGLLLSQGRAFGMYFVLSTQQPSRKLIEGSIQSNIGQKLSLRVATKTDAEVVFDSVNVGLEKIEHKGRGFYLKGGTPCEVQCYYIGDPKLRDEPDAIAKLLKHYKVKECSDTLDANLVIDEVAEIAQTVENTKKVKSNKEIRELLYGKNKKGVK